MTTFVLVHGAWGGSWGFGKVRRQLQKQGHDVFTPSLTGIGERSHLITPSTGLDTHITDVVNTVLYEDLNDIVLLGFSYGGMVVTGALARIGDRVRQLVYLDALVPNDGDTAYDLLRIPTKANAIDPQHHWLLPPRPRESATPEETIWANQRRSMQPLKTLTDSVHLDRPLTARDFGLTYIKATADTEEKPDSAFWQAAHMAKKSNDWQYHEIECNHMIPSNKPDELVAILEGISA